MSEQEKDELVEEKKVIIFDRSKFINADEYSDEELQSLASLYDNSFRDIKEGEIISGKIVGVSDDHVVIDVGCFDTAC